MEHLLTREIISSIGRKTALGRSVLWPVIYSQHTIRLTRNDPIAVSLASQGTTVMSPEGLSTTQCREAEVAHVDQGSRKGSFFVVVDSGRRGGVA